MALDMMSGPLGMQHVVSMHPLSATIDIGWLFVCCSSACSNCWSGHGPGAASRVRQGLGAYVGIDVALPN